MGHAPTIVTSTATALIEPDAAHTAVAATPAVTASSGETREAGNEVAISVRDLGKCYEIYARPHHRLMQTLFAGRRQFYREFWALKDVSFEVRRGETVGIIGRNGSGKSTLLQLIAGTLTPTTGEVQVNGRVAALLELGSGFNPEFTGRENAYLNGQILGLTREQVEERFDAIAAFADIGEFMDQPVKTYSSGMFMRLAFAVVAHVDPQILIIDEALAVGDAFFTQKCMRFLRQFKERGTIFFVSHDTAAVTNLCDRAVWLQKGQVKRIGAAKEVCEDYLEAGYVERQGEGSAVKPPVPRPASGSDMAFTDQRLAYVNTTALRNDIEILNLFDNDPKRFGMGFAKITAVHLLDEAGRALSWVVGGELVTIAIRAQALQSLDNVILGFMFKDRLGQPLFAENTWVCENGRNMPIAEGEQIEARFTLRMPVLPVGDYMLAVAVAEGNQVDHVIHDWLQDALLIKSMSSSVVAGLMGLPYKSITLARVSH